MGRVRISRATSATWSINGKNPTLVESGRVSSKRILYVLLPVTLTCTQEHRNSARIPSRNFCSPIHFWISPPTNLAMQGRGSPCFADKVRAARRVPKPRRLGNRCPQIASPSCKPIVFLLPFAMCAVFPRSDYFGSSILGVVHLRSSRLAMLRAGRTIRVSVLMEAVAINTEASVSHFVVTS